MKRAFITGIAGFIGRHMAGHLGELGWDVWGVDKLVGGKDCLTEFRDNAWKYDLVVHCAYHVGGRAGIDGNRANLAKNLELDAAMFDWAVRTRQPRVLYFSSAAVYPKWMQAAGHSIPLREQDVDPLVLDLPDADYGWAKLNGERLAANARELGVNVHVVRPFSGYGEDQSLDYPFPAIVSRARQGNLTVWGPPGQTRDWIHFTDVVAGAMAVVEADFQQPINLCTGIGTEMGDLAKMVWREEVGCDPDCGHGIEGDHPIYDESKPTGVLYRVGDPTLMNTIYTAKVSLEEGIRRALA